MKLFNTVMELDIAPSVDDVLLLPNYSEIESRQNIKISPYIFNAPMDMVGSFELAEAMVLNGQIGCVSRFTPTGEDQFRKELLDNWSSLDSDKKSRLFMAIGLNDSLLNSTLPNDLNLAIDIAHGDCKQAHDLVRLLKESGHKGAIMSGSIARPSKYLDLYDFIRVGIGGGSRCQTRVKTGIGVPTFTSVSWINSYRYKNTSALKYKIVADGGIREPGDAAKYLAAGADYVMSGNLFAQTAESPGWQQVEIPFSPNETISFPIQRRYKYVKPYRGQASAEFQSEVLKKEIIFNEGTSKQIEFEGKTVESVIQDFNAGIQSACAYLGIQFSDLPRYSTETVSTSAFILITNSSYLEGLPK